MNMPDAFSLEISFPSNAFRLDGPTTYCGINVSDSIAPYYERQHWLNLAENAVREWENKLQSSETVNKAVWKMNYKGVSSEEEYLNAGCNIPIVFKPDLTTDVLKIPPTRKGHFETTLLFDYNSLRGFYHIEAYYLDNHDEKVDVFFEVVDKGTKPTKILVPESSPTPSKQTKKTPSDSKYSTCEKYKNNSSKYETCKKSIDKPQSKTKQSLDSKYKTCEKYKGNTSKYDTCKKSIDKKSQKLKAGK